MKAQALLGVLKIVAFSLCLVFFVWKVVESLQTYLEANIGTKIEVVPSGKTVLPSFAVCRTPTTILDSKDSDGWFFSELYNLTISQMNKLEAYRYLEETRNVSYHSVFKLFLSNITESVVKIALSTEANAGTARNWPQIASVLADHPEEWYYFFDPLYGSCYATRPLDSLAQLKERLGGKGVDHVDIFFDNPLAYRVNLWPTSQHMNISNSTAEAPTDTTTTPPPPTTATDYVIDYNCSGEDCDAGYSPDHIGGSGLISPDELDFGYLNELFVFAFHPRSFIRTHEGIRIGREDKIFTLAQEIIDHSNVADSVGCETRMGYDEDRCLYQCLVDLFVEQFGCLHSRLAFLQGVKFPDSSRECTHADLKALTPTITREYLQAWEDSGSNVSASNLEEVGWLQIQAWWAALKTDDRGKMCPSCKFPCRKTILKAMYWNTDYDFGILNYARFQVGIETGHAAKDISFSKLAFLLFYFSLTPWSRSTPTTSCSRGVTFWRPSAGTWGSSSDCLSTAS